MKIVGKLSIVWFLEFFCSFTEKVTHIKIHYDHFNPHYSECPQQPPAYFLLDQYQYYFSYILSLSLSFSLSLSLSFSLSASVYVCVFCLIICVHLFRPCVQSNGLKMFMITTIMSYPKDNISQHFYQSFNLQVIMLMPTD